MGTGTVFFCLGFALEECFAEFGIRFEDLEGTLVILAFKSGSA